MGPMLLVARVLGAEPSGPLLLLIGSYGAMQQGIVLVNTAEDLPEDRAAGIRTVAAALGMKGCLGLSAAMVGGGGLGTLGALGWMLARRTGSEGEGWILAPLVIAWAWVVWRIAATYRVVVGSRTEEAALAAMRPRARAMPLWITATAWTALFAAWRIGAEWVRP